MSIIELFSLLTLLGTVGIVGLKLWNMNNVLIKKQPGYEGIWILLGLAGYLILWFFAFEILATDPASDLAVNQLYLASFTLQTFLLFLTSMLTIIELLLKFSVLGEQITSKPAFRDRGVSNKPLG